MKTCWNCKHFTHTGGHGSYDWGWCNNFRGNVNADDTCDDFTEKENVKKVNPMKIDNIVIRGACINGEHHWVVYFYDNSGNEMEKKRFTDWADAGEYAMKLETFWKYNRG